MTKKKNLSDITDELIQLGYRIIVCRGKMAFGEDVDDKINEPEQNRILDLIKPLIKDSEHTKKVQADSVKDVVTMLSNGKITVTEAIKFMTLIKSKLEVEEKEISVQLQKTVSGLITGMEDKS